MYVFITILIVIVCVLLSLVVLVQNPKGGGLGAGFGGGSSNLMGGVQKTTDFLEKATWVLAISLLLLSLVSNAFLGDKVSSNSGQDSELFERILDEDVE